jgi:hypothetical protein
MKKKPSGKQTYTLTELRNNIYQLVDLIIETGEPIIIDRRGVNLKIELDSGITPVMSKSVEEFWAKLADLEPVQVETLDKLTNSPIWDESEWLKKWE